MAPKAPRNAAAAAPAAAPAPVADYSVLADDDGDDDGDDSDSDAAPAVQQPEAKKAKAKSKAAKGAGAAAGAAGADGAAGAGDGWTTITDERRVRYEKSKVKKALEAQAELLAKKDMSTEDALAQAMAQADRAAAKLTGTGFRIDAKGLKGPERTDKKKKKNAGPKYVVISSEKQMVEVVTQVVSNVPNNNHLHLSAVGDKVQEMTNKSWKKAYAPTYGTLPEFFKKHSAHFYVDPNQRVMLRAEWNAVKVHAAAAAADPLRATDAPKKKKAKGQSAAAGAGAGAGNGHGAVAKAGAGAVEAADDNVAFRVLLVVVLIIAVGIAVFCGLEGITLAQFIGRLRAALRL